jgi:uncharacterized membrane protein HdeD (DUF308 family)
MASTTIGSAVEGAVNRVWWGIVLRGLVAIALGVFILVRPLESVAVFALVIAIWALIDGITSMVHSFDLRPIYKQWWLMLLGGLISFVFGVAALFYYPILSLAFAVVWVAWWLLLIGIVAVYAAFQQKSAQLPWGWTLVYGLLCIAAGVVAFTYQGATLSAIMGLLAAFGIVGGIFLLVGAVKFKSVQHDVKSAVGASPY